VFTKAVNIDENSVKHVISVDVNEDNVAVKVLDRVFILEQELRGLPLDTLDIEKLCRVLKVMDMLVELFMVENVRGRGILG